MTENTYTAEEVKKHNSLNDLWVVYDNDVFDITKFVDDHPGGEEVLKANAGKDSTQEFDDVGHSESAKSKMKQFRIGRIAGAPARVEQPKKKVTTPASTSASATRPAEAGGLGALKIPIIIIVLAIIAYFTMASDAMIEDDQ
ncbi:cytochrome b5 A [Cavenderia fasciculata]|uniref:Cytochrome b5 A n=1 Tax=Cavenderia fasciculata TaxID=261658 RepID=F4Q8L7_CACFS|nr:cytochrome b5 A [Cavenderia fasciculata]EGG16117.1 cytochrome b5 A [Cavenderia fasciculata]|eukprot:XP_004352447.1 cytochrome b5 A [Cavenderia fasciculata]